MLQFNSSILNLYQLHFIIIYIEITFSTDSFSIGIKGSLLSACHETEDKGNMDPVTYRYITLLGHNFKTLDPNPISEHHYHKIPKLVEHVS